MKPTKTLTLYTLLLTTLLTAACATKPVRKDDAAGQGIALADIKNWEMRARIGLRSRAQNGSATIIWTETPEQQTLRILGPLGGGLVLLQMNASGITVRDSKGALWQGQDASELIYRVSGWKIPVSALRWWMMGMIEPGSDARVTHDDGGRLNSIKQDSWQVSLDKYRRFSSFELPSLIIMETLTEPADEHYIRVKMIVKSWTVKQ